MRASAVSVERVSKKFGAVRALSEVTLDVAPGEIRALCGENGAGKSTLVRLLMGIVSPDSGTISVDGQPVHIRGPQQAQNLGLGLVAQELSLAPRLSILDNIWLGSAQTPLLYRIGHLRKRAQAALGLLGAADLDLDKPVANLPIGQRQIVEIARLIARDARVLILDEPTATLSDAEIERLIATLKHLRDQGHSILYISHRLGEIFDLCDTVTVLRNGELVETAPVADMKRDRLIELMLGRQLGDMYPPASDIPMTKEGVSISALRVRSYVAPVSLAAPAGCITCIAGQIGSGASEINRALAGLLPDARGSVAVAGRPLPLRSVPASVDSNVLFVSDDRAAEGIFAELRVLDNLVAAELPYYSSAGLVIWPRLRALARDIARAVGIDLRRLRARAGELSGGNQQKLLFGRAMARKTAGVLLMNEPTRGIDIGARADVYRLMRDLCARGWTLIMTSSDLEEVVGMADVVYTMYRGTIVGRYARTDITMAAILSDITHPPAATEVAGA